MICIVFCVGSLPFLTDVNTAMGIITKTYLEQTISLSKLNEGKVTHTHVSDASRKIQNIFTACADVKADLINGFAFWDEVRDTVGCGGGSVIALIVRFSNICFHLNS